MSTNTLKFTTHEGVTKIVPLDTVRLVKPLSEEDKERTKESLKEKRGIDIDPSRLSIRIEFADRTSKLARESLDELKGQGVALVNMGADRFVPATNITGAEAFSSEDAERLKGEEYTLNQAFRSKVDPKAGTMLSSATPVQVLDRRAKALGEAAPPGAPKATDSGSKSSNSKRPAARPS
jgi:hypothetical protein